MINPNKIVCALDFNDLTKAESFVASIDYDIVYKLGMEFFFNFGLEGIKKLKKIKKNIKIFLDLKLHDIPNTVSMGLDPLLKKIDPSFPNEVILVLDATTGQNALNQVEEFSKIHDLTGLIITKLDSTAKGGVVLAICKKFELPIVAVGMGEKETDLQPFNAEYFSKALLGIKN